VSKGSFYSINNNSGDWDDRAISVKNVEIMEQFEFDNQRPNEEIVFMRRRHPWIFWKSSLILLFVILIVLIAFLIWGASKVSVVVSVASVIFLILYFLGRWFVYTSDIFILTNQRIINIDQRGFFTRRVSEAELENIQNVTYEIKGPIRSFLNFGEIIISTAGNTPGLTLSNVENPHFIQEKIVSLRKETGNSKTESPKRILQ
jgi:membrane protein YdbS with pleckstrin-like domain